MKNNTDTRLRRGFTFVELMAVVAVISILAVIAVSFMKFANQKSAMNRAEVEMQAMRNALECYRAKKGEYPNPYANPNLKFAAMMSEPAYTNIFGYMEFVKNVMWWIQKSGAGGDKDCGGGVGFLPYNFEAFLYSYPVMNALEGCYDPEMVTQYYHKDGHCHPFEALEPIWPAGLGDMYNYFPRTTGKQAGDAYNCDNEQEYNLAGFVDPWGNMYYYVATSPYHYELWSMGPQRKQMEQNVPCGAGCNKVKITFDPDDGIEYHWFMGGCDTNFIITQVTNAWGGLSLIGPNVNE